MSFPYTNAVTDNESKVVEIDAKNPFRGADGEIKLMGVVHNNGDIPLEVKLGVDITTITDNATETTVTEEATTYSRVLYPYSVSPFKFSIKSPDRESQTTLIGKPFINKYEKLSTPNYDGLVTLNYTNIPSGENSDLVGTVKNSGPFNLRNVAVYASAHDENRTQIDSVKSNVIPVIEPGQEMAFTAIPDLTIKSQIKYYSCAGVDMNPPQGRQGRRLRGLDRPAAQGKGQRNRPQRLLRQEKERAHLRAPELSTATAAPTPPHPTRRGSTPPTATSTPG